jgi:hypothetical protein
MATRDWGRLSEGTQERYLRHGIGAREYERGDSLKAARGHAATPEHPSEAARNPERYSGYLARNPNARRTRQPQSGALPGSRASVIDNIVNLKTDIAGGEDQESRNSFRKVVSHNPETGDPRSKDQLRQIEGIYRTAKDLNWSASQLYYEAKDFFGDDWEDFESAFYYH